MADLKECLAEFDRILAAAETEAEGLLRDYGATPAEVDLWRRTELAYWRTVAACQRLQIIAIAIGGPDACPIVN